MKFLCEILWEFSGAKCVVLKRSCNNSEKYWNPSIFVITILVILPEERERSLSVNYLIRFVEKQLQIDNSLILAKYTYLFLSLAFEENRLRCFAGAQPGKQIDNLLLPLICKNDCIGRNLRSSRGAPLNRIWSKMLARCLLWRHLWKWTECLEYLNNNSNDKIIKEASWAVLQF